MLQVYIIIQRIALSIAKELLIFRSGEIPYKKYL